MKHTLRNLGKPVLASTLVLMMHGCGNGNDAKSSDLNITNGVNVQENQYPATVLLVMEVAGAQGICTATFVNDRQAVTAGHCVEGLKENRPRLAFIQSSQGENKIVEALSFRRNPSYSILRNNGVNPSDLALVTFPAGSAPAVAKLAKQTPQLESVLTIVGYGQNRSYFAPSGEFTGSGSGTKRMGTNILAQNTNGFLSFIGVADSRADVETGQWVSAGPGDSGGPMFINEELVGVTSGGKAIPLADGSVGVLSNYVDLNSQESRMFLRGNLL